MFVPLFMGLYEALFGFRVLGTIYVYKKARNRNLLFYDFWKNPLAWLEIQKKWLNFKGL